MGESALHFAVSAHGSFFVKSLLDLPGLNINTADTYRRTPVHYAARDGKTDVLEILLRHPAIDVAAVDVERKTALHYAAASSAVTAVTLLLEIPETDVFAVDVEDETALHHAARSLDQQSAEAIMRKLVDHGVPIDHLGEHGTALQLASRNQLCQNVMTLLSCGADAVHSDNAPGGWTVLHHCLRCPAESKQVEAVAALVGKGVELDAVVDDDDYYEAHMWDDVDFQSECTPLFLAAVGAKDVECMKLLLAAGAKSDIPVINRCDTSLFRAEGKVEPGEAELFLAAMFRHLWDQSCVSADDVKAAADRVCLLLDHGAGIDKGPGRYSALQYACKYAIGGLFELLALLLNNAGREHISLEHLEEVISTYQSEGSHPNAKETAKTLVKFANRVYPERIDNVNASGAT